MHRLRVDAGLYVWLALGIYLLPLSWLLAAASAAVFHELCHFFAAKWRNVFCSGMTLGTGGMIMHLSDMEKMDTVYVSAAGPAGSFLLGCLIHVWPQIAVCGVVHGLYNLLPIYPLDGGRILRVLIGDRAKWVESGCIFLMLAAGSLGVFWMELGISPFLISLAVCCRAIQRKFPCKEAVIGVQ